MPRFPLGELEGGAETVNRYRFTISEPKKLGLGLRQQETNADLVLVDAEGAELRAAREAGAAQWLLNDRPQFDRRPVSGPHLSCHRDLPTHRAVRHDHSLALPMTLSGGAAARLAAGVGASVL